ncbi:hypothetical protein C8J57DRAFT_1728432 [Mycena rebaudengoi]|nr:hypothetical protein C8J57DRAFT_1732237 [Mycena rebaudengoi]KAJ7236040.1 hypothetical protein C8J57DRAFT_1728432 [Mycena rebaudengoi]
MAPAGYKPAPPENLPDIWGKRGPPVAPRRQPTCNDTEAVPPVPDHLRGQECLYGYFITNQLLEAYWATHPDARPNLIFNPNNFTVDRVAQQFGLQIWIDRKRGPVESIAWFSYTDYGEVCIEKVPTAARLEPFEKELGITEKAQWLGTGLPITHVCVNIHRLIALSNALLLVLKRHFQGYVWLSSAIFFTSIMFLFLK